MALAEFPVVKLGDQRYHTQPSRVSLPGSLANKVSFGGRDFVGVTCVPWGEQLFDDDDLEKVLRMYAEVDDVWTHNFLECVFVVAEPGSRCEVRSRDTICIDTGKSRLTAGPYALEATTGNLYQVSKLVRDTHAAFFSAIAPKAASRATYHEIPYQDELEIALPSRLYFQKSDAQPLAGVRIAVKDTIALKGLRTGYGSRSWRELAVPEKSTAPSIQALVDAGACIVGKLKSTEFAEGVDPCEWFDVCPQNPRGDGHQKPSSSSTGSAVAAAAYEWLDVSVGTDTGGSIRHPAGVNGVFGQRPTHGKIDLSGVLGATAFFNTVGIFARDVNMFGLVGSYFSGGNVEAPSKIERRRQKYNLLYPTRSASGNLDPWHGGQPRWFPDPTTDSSQWTEAEKHMEAAVRRIEEELECERIPFNIYEIWAATPPKGQSKSLDEATGKIYGDITTSAACVSGIDRFIYEYTVANNGQPPEMSDVVRRRFEHGRFLPEQDVTSALEGAHAFRNWMETIFFGAYDQEATTFIVFPQSYGRPEYRDVVPDRSVLFSEAFSIYAIGFLCGCPDYTIPIAEVPYHSRMSDQTEFLPVSISLAGKPGADAELFEIVQELHGRGVIRNVKAGSRLYQSLDSA